MSVLLLAGPTASGKSALALALAERIGAVVINADALQVYRDWRILTARPSDAEMARAPHQLYGHVPIADASYSVGRWLRELTPILAEGRPAILVGGAGLYFTALTRGLAPIPAIPPEIRAALEARLEREGRGALAHELARRDPETAAGLDAANPRRVIRALEVLEATGRGMAAWARATEPPLLPAPAGAFVLQRPVDELNERIARRLERMAAEGALVELAAVRAHGVDWRAPGMKALGARALARHLDGEISLRAALDEATTLTRRFAKRQRTWFRSRFGAWPRISADAAGLDALTKAALGGG